MKPFRAMAMVPTLTGYESASNPTTVRIQKERPILFNGSMVKAILDGSKTQTRRVVKRNASGRVELKGRQWHIEDENAILACPHGSTGDRLWVRETFSTDFKNYYPNDPIWYRADGERDISTRSEGGRDFPAIYSPESKVWVPFKWKPSIFMPRWASRITLEIIGVRVERLQEISEADALTEGVDLSEELYPDVNSADKSLRRFPRLWDSINAKKHPWKSNPWVWVIEFKRIQEEQLTAKSSQA